MQRLKRFAGDSDRRLVVLINDAVNYTDMQILTEEVIPLMRENGRIIDVASECGIVLLGEASRDLQGKYLSPTLTTEQQGIDWQHFGIDSIVQMWSILRMPNWETGVSIVMVKKCSQTLISKMRVTRRMSRDIFNTTAKSVPSVFLDIGEEEKYLSKDEEW